MLIKICGLSTPQTLEAAIAAGADMVGFVFHPKSPRYLDWQTANKLGALVPSNVLKVALFVNENDSAIDILMNDVISPGLLQLHGSMDDLSVYCAETPERVALIKDIHQVPVMKAIGIAVASDLSVIPAYAAVADRILLDAKPPKDAAYPGGHGKTFDWNILKDLDPALPFMLSGGLMPDNVAQAITTLRALGVNLTGVDVSSGVESAPGVKDVHKIRDFIQAARSAG